MQEFTLNIEGTARRVPAGTFLHELAAEESAKRCCLVVGAKVDNELEDLAYLVNKDCRVEWIDLTQADGTRIYARSLSFVLVRATKELFPGAKVTIEHSLCKGLYGEIHYERQLSEEELAAVSARMGEIIGRDEPIIMVRRPLPEALALFEHEGQEDKVRLLKYRTTPTVKVYQCGHYYDYYYGYTVPSTGYLKVFGLRPYPPGFILQFPTMESPAALPAFADQPKLAKIYGEFEHWGDILDLDDVGALNDHIAAGEGGDIIRVAEALHEKKIGQIADMIDDRRDQVRLILMAGPSSSGKTTFAQRLSIQLRVLGFKPLAISLDDYFIDRDRTPLDEHGKPDLEALQAIDLEFFNRQLTELIAGREVQLPQYDFIRGERAPEGRRASLARDGGLILVEGIHGLNEHLTPAIPREEKFKIYISALSQVNLDHHNRIPTTDTRIIRRIVRDNQFRSHDAMDTIRVWPAVRRGEEKNIFPFQEEADVMFNSTLPYELAVLKNYAEPLLAAIGPETEEYTEAKRLQKFLSYFLPLEPMEVASNSILREFIGESCFFRK